MDSRDTRRRRAQIIVLVIVAAMVLSTLLGVISSLQAQATDTYPTGTVAGVGLAGGERSAW